MKTSKELVDLIDKTLEGGFGKSSATRVTLPDGHDYTTDVDYVWQFWERFKEAIDLEWFE